MKGTRFVLIPFLMVLLSSCQKYSKDEVRNLIKSNEPDNLVRAFYLIGENNDTTFIKEVVSDPYDPRVTHNFKFRGMSVYQSKMIALKKISGASPPGEITFRPDSSIVEFYCKWVIENTGLNCPR